MIYNKQYAPRFFKYENLFYPTIHLIREESLNFASVQIDQGAVAHILNGADIFAQGITFVDREFEEGEMVIVINPQHAVICLGKSLLSSENLLNGKGKGILNIHFLGDDIWEGKIKS
ncbi:MAG: PUA domain-containing protein [Candidatus Hodarchaeales archaeon]